MGEASTDLTTALLEKVNSLTPNMLFNEEKYNEFLAASSAGKFFSSEIRGKFAGSKVEEPPDNVY